MNYLKRSKDKIKKQICFEISRREFAIYIKVVTAISSLTLHFDPISILTLHFHDEKIRKQHKLRKLNFHYNFIL